MKIVNNFQRIKPHWPHPKLVDGRQLKAGRTVLGITILEMATLANVDKNTVVRLERKRNLPLHLGAAINIANVLVERGISFSLDGNQVGIYFSSQRCRHHINQ